MNEQKPKKELNKDLILSSFVLFHILTSRLTYFGIWYENFYYNLHILEKFLNISVAEYINTASIEYIITWLIVLFYLIYGIFNSYYDINKNKKVYIIYMIIFIFSMFIVMSFFIFPRNPFEPLDFYKSGDFKNL